MERGILDSHFGIVAKFEGFVDSNNIPEINFSLICVSLLEVKLRRIEIEMK